MFLLASITFGWSFHIFFFFILASFNDKIYQSIRFVVFYVTSRTKEMRNQMESPL